MAVLGREAEAFTRREAGRDLRVLPRPLDDRDDHDLVALRDVRVLEGDLDARERAERRDAFLGLANVARAVGLADRQRDAAFDGVRLREDVAADHESPDDHLLALGDQEASARARAIGRLLERVLHVDERVALLLVRVGDAPARLLELHGAHPGAQLHVGGPASLSGASACAPVNARSQSCVRGPSFTGMRSQTRASHARRASDRGRTSTPGSSGATGSGTPVAS